MGRNTISFTSTSSGWLIAKPTSRANDSAGSAMGATRSRTASATSGSLMPSSSSVATEPGETTPITVTFDATNLTQGDYSADICVNSNDLTNKRLPVPVTLTVQ